jgi:hypothetical protein
MEKVSRWSESEKKSFFDNFSREPLIEDLNSAGSDPILRLEKFVTLSDEDIEKVITIQVRYYFSHKFYGRCVQALFELYIFFSILCSHLCLGQRLRALDRLVLLAAS